MDNEPCNCGDPECKRCYPYRKNYDEWLDPDPDEMHDNPWKYCDES